ncbi:hypothetical protein SHJG_2031 [Streptomyces hygroscopicus subsp. jinggangensis 5008]|nr:hypothetical protein SHJG_2031 [Streptomyces hygroscopicus subsp. jinggangensis 5008]AGF61462.1 hypothetical protein SHJGH_1796 [Streptomyces hygroscopicus subsp. jinggangensis TL01]
MEDHRSPKPADTRAYRPDFRVARGTMDAGRPPGADPASAVMT